MTLLLLLSASREVDVVVVEWWRTVTTVVVCWRGGGGGVVNELVDRCRVCDIWSSDVVGPAIAAEASSELTDAWGGGVTAHDADAAALVSSTSLTLLIEDLDLYDGGRLISPAAATAAPGWYPW